MEEINKKYMKTTANNLEEFLQKTKSIPKKHKVCGICTELVKDLKNYRHNEYIFKKNIKYCLRPENCSYHIQRKSGRELPKELVIEALECKFQKFSKPIRSIFPKLPRASKESLLNCKYLSGFPECGYFVINRDFIISFKPIKNQNDANVRRKNKNHDASSDIGITMPTTHYKENITTIENIGNDDRFPINGNQKICEKEVGNRIKSSKYSHIKHPEKTADTPINLIKSNMFQKSNTYSTYKSSSGSMISLDQRLTGMSYIHINRVFKYLKEENEEFLINNHCKKSIPMIKIFQKHLKDYNLVNNEKLLHKALPNEVKISIRKAACEAIENYDYLPYKLFKSVFGTFSGIICFGQHETVRKFCPIINPECFKLMDFVIKNVTLKKNRLRKMKFDFFSSETDGNIIYNKLVNFEIHEFDKTRIHSCIQAVMFYFNRYIGSFFKYSHIDNLIRAIKRKDIIAIRSICACLPYTIYEDQFELYTKYMQFSHVVLACKIVPSNAGLLEGIIKSLLYGYHKEKKFKLDVIDIITKALFQDPNKEYLPEWMQKCASKKK